MQQATKIFLLSLALLTGCAQAPVLSEADAQSKTASFLNDVATDSQAAYAETSARFQGSTTVESFQGFVDQSNLKQYNSFEETGISYQQGVGINAAKVDGDIVFTDLTRKNASFIWSYDNETKEWVIDAFKFN